MNRKSDMSAAKILQETREAEERIFNTKFCSSCQRMKPKSEGKLVPTNTSHRWKCGDCLKITREQKKRSKTRSHL